MECDQDGLPAGTYHFWEAFCAAPDCDCRRVQLWVMRAGTRDILATIALGLDEPEFHRRWAGYRSPEGYEAGGLYLEPFGEQSRYAPALLEAFEEHVLPSPGYRGRLRRHYKLFKTAAGRSQKQGRNAACACGSGKKFKRCCALARPA